MGNLPKHNKDVRINFKLDSVIPSIPGFILNGILGSGRLNNYSAIITHSNREDLEKITKLVEDGKLKPVIDSEFTLDNAVQAAERLATGRAQGKVVIVHND